MSRRRGAATIIRMNAGGGIGDLHHRDNGVPGRDGTQDTGRRSMAVWMLLSFVATMLGLRALTFGQQTQILPVPDVAGSGIHVHHFVWGIVLLGVVGFCSLMTADPGSNRRLAALFGIGTALVVDEFALCLTLRDVYFDPEGAWSVELAAIVALGLLCNVAWRSRIRGRRAWRMHAPRLGDTTQLPDAPAVG